MKRRDLLKLSAAATLAVPAAANAQQACSSDGTPLQFIPKKAADSDPLPKELEKHPKCPYCGMDRREHHRGRMLVQYSDDLADGLCSIHCLAISLSLNIDREPKNIWGADYGAEADPRPLHPVDKLTYLIGADLKHAMTKRSKHSFASKDVLEQFKTKHGGTPGNFDEALKQAYLDMAEDVRMIRKMREERRRHMEKQKQS